MTLIRRMCYGVGYFRGGEAKAAVRSRYTFSFRFGEEGRSREYRIGRTGLALLTGGVALIFVLTTQFIYEYREGLSKIRELRGLRNRVSEQSLTLYSLNAKFESLESEVERLRTLDARVKSLVNINESLRPGPGTRGRASGVGGAETPEVVAANRLDRLLDLRAARLKHDVLVDARNLEVLCEKLDARRIFLESLPALWPVRGILTSAFGVRVSPFTDTKVFHQGLDIEVPAGTPVKAAAGGKVVRSGYEALYGNILVVDHGNGYRTVYAHLSELLAGTGDLVRKGDVIGRAGDTGRTTGPHLHYEVHVNGLPVNPTRFLN